MLIKQHINCYKNLSRQALIGILLVLIQSTAIGTCFFLSLYFVNDLGLTVNSAGLLLSLYGAGTVTGGIISTKLIDHSPLKFTLFTSLLLQSACFLSLTVFSQKSIIAFTLFCLGTFAYITKTANDVWLLNSAKGNTNIQTQIVGASRTAMNLGLGISGVLAGFTIYFGFHTLFIFYSLSLFLISYIFKQVEDGTFRLNERSDETQIINKKNKLALTLVLFCLFFAGLMIGQLSTTYPIYIQSLFPRYGLQSVSILFLLDTALIVTFQAPLTYSLRKYNQFYLLSIGLLFMGLGLYILIFTVSFGTALFSCVIWTTGEMLFMPAAQLLAYKNGDSRHKGMAVGLYQSIYAISSIIGPTAGTVVFTKYGSTLLWGGSFIISLICMALCLFYVNFSKLHSSTAYSNATT